MAQETIEIDGVLYKEVNGDLIEVPKPPSPPKKISVSVGGRIYVFEEGGIYLDAAGDYRVKEILPGNKLRVVYLNGNFEGQEREYAALDRAKIIHNEILREDTRHKMRSIEFSGSDDYFTMGYLASKGNITAEIGPKHHKSFPALYKSLTGEDPAKYEHHGYSLSPSEGRWSYTLRLYFPTPPPQVLNKMVFPPDASLKQHGSQMELACNDYILTLFKKGFSIGKNSGNIGSIIAGVSNDDNRRNFQAGVDYVV